jgi:hypothetical protein
MSAELAGSRTCPERTSDGDGGAAGAAYPARARYRSHRALARRLDGLLRIETLLTVSLFAALASLRLGTPIADPDLGWHLAAGRHILETGTLPRVDGFSYVAQGRPWLLYSWLAEVLFAAIDRALGPGGLIVTATTLVLSTFAVVLGSCRAAGARPAVAVAATFFAALVAMPTWSVRPQLFSFLFVAVLARALAALERAATSRAAAPPPLRRLWLLVPIMALWANTHVFFVHGLSVLGIHVLTGWRRWLWDVEGRRPRWRSLACLAAIGGALLVNPYGYRLLLHLGDLAGERTTFAMVRELQTPSLHDLHGKVLTAFFFSIVVALAFSRVPTRPTELPTVLLFAGLAYAMARNMPFLALLGAPVLARHADSLVRSGARAYPPLSPARRRLHGALLATIAAVAVIALARSAVHPPQRAMSRTRFPAEAVAYLTAQPPLGRLFNHFNWGGYLIAHLYPRYLVSMDGRTGVYGDEILRRYRATQLLAADWRRFLAECDPQVILWPVGEPFVRAIELLPEWRRLYEDDVAVIFVRASPASQTQRSRRRRTAPRRCGGAAGSGSWVRRRRVAGGMLVAPAVRSSPPAEARN